MQITKLLIIAIGLMATIVLAADRFDYVVRNDFFAGFTGNEAALDRAMKTTEEALAENPKHAEALVWHGAGLLFRSGKLFQKQDFPNALPIYAQAIKELDEAVELEPDNIGVRVPRGAPLMTAARATPDPNRARPMFERAASDFQHAYDMQASYPDKLG